MKTDHRIYLAEPTWHPQIKRDDGRLLCYLADETDGLYHRISAHELYFARGDEVYCVNCALKKEIATFERPSLEHHDRGPFQEPGSAIV